MHRSACLRIVHAVLYSVHAASDGPMHSTSAGLLARTLMMMASSHGESDGVDDQHSSMHGQIHMPADSACGAHTPSDSAMHKTSTGAHTCDNDAMHTTLLGKSNGIPGRDGGMQAQDNLKC